MKGCGNPKQASVCPALFPAWNMEIGYDLNKLMNEAERTG